MPDPDHSAVDAAARSRYWLRRGRIGATAAADPMPTETPRAATPPSPPVCVARRLLAKSVDVLLFGAAAFVIGRLLLPDQFNVGGVVPAFGTSVWVLGFFVVADTVCAQLLGATPGELLAGIRVRMADGSPLTWSARQDRTTDALVDGTLGAPGLLRALLRGQPAPYDRDWRVDFLQAGALQRLAAGLVVAVGLVVLLAVGGWLALFKGLDADTRVAASRVLRWVGVPVRAVWANPITGALVELPEGWYVRRSTSRPMAGNDVVEFECADGPAKCRVVLGTLPQSEVGAVDPERDTTAASIEHFFDFIVGERDIGRIDTRAGLAGEARLGQVYVAELAPLPSAAQAARIGLCWFTERKHTWVLAATFERADGPADRAGDATALALALVHASRGGRGD